MTRRRVLLVTVGMISVLLWFVVQLRRATAGFAYDFAINWVAAQGMRAGQSVYDWYWLRLIGIAQVGPPMEELFDFPFHSYIGPPSTAALLLPLTALSFPTALLVYRGITLLCFGLTVWIAGLALPAPQRSVAWGAGLIAVGVLPAVQTSLWLGQVDALVTLGLAIGVYGLSRERWYAAGAGFGIAALLKVSPAVLLVWLVLRGAWRSAVGALAVVGAGLGAAAVLGQPRDVLIFVRDIAPILSQGTRHTDNVALPAFAARLADPASAWDWNAGLGLFRFGSPLIIVLALGILWRRRRSDPRLGELASLIMVALLAGPVTWTHYYAWCIVPAVLVAPRVYAQLRSATQVLLRLAQRRALR